MTNEAKRNEDTVEPLVRCGCGREWPADCQQATCIRTHGACCVCRYVERQPEGMTQEQCEAEMTAMFGPGPYFPTPNTGVTGVTTAGRNVP